MVHPLAFLAALLMIAPVHAQDPSVERLTASPRHHEWVAIPSGKRTVHAFVAHPEAAGRAPAVIVIHENRGLTDWVRSFADQLAEAGYLAIAPDLLSDFDASRHRSSDFKDEDAARTALYDLKPDQVIADLKAVQAHAAQIPSANGKVAVIGFCWGGGQAFRLATETTGLVAALVFYGAAPEDEDAFRRISAPVYGFYGERDERINARLPDVERIMSSYKKRFEPVIYKGAGHAFMRKGDDAAGPDADKAAHDAAWKRLTAILSAL